MFTGIVQGKGRVIAIEDKGDFRTHIIELPSELVNNLETGASIANNGCCLTVTKIDGNKISFDLVKETLRLTNLGELTVGSEVNIERAAK
ncbi:riboflavin synthase, partial [Proteus mirabilis]|nr:riboflavin synthase [Proteus mirabilis]